MWRNHPTSKARREEDIVETNKPTMWEEWIWEAERLVGLVACFPRYRADCHLQASVPWLTSDSNTDNRHWTWSALLMRLNMWSIFVCWTKCQAQHFLALRTLWDLLILCQARLLWQTFLYSLELQMIGYVSSLPRWNSAYTFWLNFFALQPWFMKIRSSSYCGYVSAIFLV